MTSNETTAEILNDLVQINNDRVAGYEKAIKELDGTGGDKDLTTLFTGMIKESHQYKLALANEVQVLGNQKASSETTTSGKLYRAWMDVKAVFTGHDRKTILNNCEAGEDAAQRAYDSALQDNSLPAFIFELITEQKQSLKGSHDKIKFLRDQIA